MQQHIHFDAPLARSHDPSTSHAAAARVTEFAGGQRAAILNALKVSGPMDSERIGRVLGIDAYAIRKRVVELQRLGLAEPTGETVPTASGRQQRVWRAV